mmetsp:Transcript_44647/g.45296  ORF Transcript_44647/g.45296 Transcript_44647/m.45296 type:complete len:135 (-) Transcript_44647:158-562(-)
MMPCRKATTLRRDMMIELERKQFSLPTITNRFKQLHQNRNNVQPSMYTVLPVSYKRICGNRYEKKTGDIDGIINKLSSSNNDNTSNDSSTLMLYHILMLLSHLCPFMYFRNRFSLCTPKFVRIFKKRRQVSGGK